MNYRKKQQQRARPLVQALLWCSILLVTETAVFAEQLFAPEWGYALDIPEGYELVQKRSTDRYLFLHSMFPVEFQIALYPAEQFSGSQDALRWVTEQLESAGPDVSFEWRGRSASIAQVDSSFRGGWATSLALPDDKGYLVMAVHSPKDQSASLENLIISTLDSVSTDEGGFFTPGPMTSFAWGKEKNVDGQYRDNLRTIDVVFDSIDSEANQAVIDREFSLLTAYLESPLMEAAWKRYYRMIYRDAWGRLDRAGFLVTARLPEDPAKAAAELLAWTQGFTYERNRQGSDFLNLPEAFLHRRGDCDSRALLMIILLHRMGIDAILMISSEYSHALAAVDVPGKGARFAANGKQYLVAETTADVPLGQIAADMADPAKWFSVSFHAFPGNGLE